MRLQYQHPGRGRLVANGDTFWTDENGVVDVPPAIAGKAPKGDDPGEGALAQPDNWKPAKGAKPDTEEDGK